MSEGKVLRTDEGQGSDSTLEHRAENEGGQTYHELRFFMLGGVLALSVGVPLCMWGLYTVTEHVVLLTALKLLLLSGAVVLVVAIMRWHKRIVLFLKVERRQGIVQVYRLFTEFVASLADRQPQVAARKANDLMKAGVSRYAWWLFVSWSVTMIFGLVLAFSSLLNSTLAWKHNRLVEQQNRLIERQNDRLLAQLGLPLLDGGSNRGPLTHAELGEIDRNIAIMMRDSENDFWRIIDAMKRSRGRPTIRRRLGEALRRTAGASACRALRALYQLSPRNRQGRVDVATYIARTLARRPKGEGASRRPVINSLECPSGANFRNIDLRGVAMRGASLEAVDFRSANLAGVDFQNSDLARANFDRAHLRRARFAKADLRQASFRGARRVPGRASFRGATLTGVRLPRKNSRGRASSKRRVTPAGAAAQ